MGNDQNEQGEIIDSGVIPGRKENSLNNSVEIRNNPQPIKHFKIDHSKLNKFMESYIIQKYLSANKENSKDKIFNSLKEFEKEELKKLFESKVKDYENKVLKGGKLHLNIENKIYNEVSNIIKYENTEEIYKRKIIDEINLVKKDDKIFQIEHLTILLIGRKGVGKSTLIKYILDLNDDDECGDNNSQNKNFVSYTSQKVTHLKLVEFKGIGLDKENNPELIGNEAVKCIMNEMKKNKNKNYNDFFHCIWYCISGTRFESSEIAVLKKLSEVYSENVMPVILVYTQTNEDKVANGMEKHARDKNIDYSFVKVLAKTNSKIQPFGREQLLNETLKKCTGALKGEMINLMTVAISTHVSNKMKKKILKDEENINNKIIEIFIKTYNEVLTDENFKNFIVNNLGKNLLSFYNEKNKVIYKDKISNKTLNLIKNSDIIKLVSHFVKYYKGKVVQIISQIINDKAKIFIDKQANIEKESSNMNLENKRCLKGFERTNEVFLKRNFYYISQKYIMYSIIKKVCEPYFNMYREQLDSIIDYLLIKDNNTNLDIDIKKYLEDCFLTKLAKFSNKYRIDIEIKPLKLKNFINASANQNLEEEFINGNLTQKSIELVDDFNIAGENNNNSMVVNHSDENWYPFKQGKFSYLEDNLQNSLKQFMEKNMIYQDSYLNIKTDNDEVYNSLKLEIRNNLIKFFESKKKDFVGKICKEYNSKIISIDKNSISNITKSKMFQDIYMNKIRNVKNSIMNIEKKIGEIKHLSIIIGGRSGVGKSTLINTMLKQEIAQTGVGGIITKEMFIYESQTLNYLRLVDTRGIELDDQFGPDKILSNLIKIIEDEKNNVEKSNKNNCDDYIQCIWYCITGNIIEQKEIEIIKKLKKNNYSIPIIVVYTYTKSKEIANKIKSDLESEFNNSIIFISILARAIPNVYDAFGLTDLLDETLKVCKKATKGKIFESIKKLSSDKIEKHFKENNKNLKNKITKNIVSKFINGFKSVLNDEAVNQYVFNLFETIFVEYMKSNDQNQKIELTQQMKDLLKDVTTFNKTIQKYTQDYKKNTISLIKQISEAKAIEYLDMQAKIEKFKFKKCLENKHISNKEDFIEIINKFLTDNFYYISQKYIIYRVIIDVIEKIEEYTENKIDEIIKGFLEDENFYKEIYLKKYEDLEQRINLFKKNGKIYENQLNSIEEINEEREPVNINNEEAPSIGTATGKATIVRRISVLSEYVPAPPPNL